MATRMQDALKHPTDFRRLRNIPEPLGAFPGSLYGGG